MRAALGPQGPQGEGQPAWGVGPASHEVPKGQKGEMSWSGNQVASAARCPLHTPASPQTALPLVTLPESTCGAQGLRGSHSALEGGEEPSA